MDKIIYISFLALATAVEVSTGLLHPIDPLLSLVYMIGYPWVLLFTRSPWIWKGGFMLVGFISLIYLVLSLFSKSPVLTIANGFASAIVYFLCLVKMNSYFKVQP